MKTVILLVFGLVAIATSIDVYPTKYDTLDIDAILGNKRLMDNYVKCMLRMGTCTEEGSVLNEVVPDALITGCSKCNDHQRASVEKVVKFLVHERPDDWKALVALHDPEGKYQMQYAQYLEKL